MLCQAAQSLDQADRSIIRRLMQRAEIIFARGGLTDADYRFIANLSGTVAAVAEELFNGVGDEAAALVDPANPQQRFANRKEMLAAVFRRKLMA